MLYYPDVMPTLAELAQAVCPETDGLSFLPTLLGLKEQKFHNHLYWEYGNQKAVRMQHWKAYTNGKDWELYDVSKDIEEKQDLSKNNPRILEKLIEISEKEHEPVRPGEIYDRDIIEKDRKQAPHKRKTKPKKRPIDE